ncbi:hypothetical protein OG241_06685 [Streptomyces sp. NBC_01390]
MTLRSPGHYCAWRNPGHGPSAEANVVAGAVAGLGMVFVRVAVSEAVWG